MLRNLSSGQSILATSMVPGLYIVSYFSELLVFTPIEGIVSTRNSESSDKRPSKKRTASLISHNNTSKKRTTSLYNVRSQFRGFTVNDPVLGTFGMY